MTPHRPLRSTYIFAALVTVLLLAATFCPSQPAAAQVASIPTPDDPFGPPPQTPSVPAPSGVPTPSAEEQGTVPSPSTPGNVPQPEAPSTTPRATEPGPTTPSGTMPLPNPFQTPGLEPPVTPIPQPGEQPKSDQPTTPGGAESGTTTPPSNAALEEALKAGFEALGKNDAKGALVHFIDAMRIEPKEPMSYYGQGIVYRQLNQLDDAVRAFSTALNSLPDGDLKADAYLRRGVVWFYKGEYGIAWEDFDEAAGLLPEQPIPVLWKGLARARQDRWLEAVNDYASAIDLNPRFAAPYINRGLAYMALNEPRKAIHDFNQAIRNDPLDAATYFKRGVAYGRYGKLRDAIDSYSEAIRLKPDYAEAYFNRSVAKGRLGETGQAAKDRAEALKLDPQIEKQLTSAG
jgi:Tfp pilus assembly protein PilF